MQDNEVPKDVYLPRSECPALLTFTPLDLGLVATIRPRVEGLVKEAVEVGKGVEGLVEEAGERH